MEHEMAHISFCKFEVKGDKCDHPISAREKYCVNHKIDVLTEALDKFVILSNATSLYIRMELIRDRIPMGLVRELDKLYEYQCEVEKEILNER
jgi:hypothetical protein